MQEIKEIYDKIHKFLDIGDFPLNAKIFIYSNNNLAKNFLNIINHKRPDIKLLGFLNSDKCKVDLQSDIITISPDMLINYQYDFVVITIINYLAEIKSIIRTINPSKIGINLISNLSYHPPYMHDNIHINTNKINFITEKLEDYNDKNLWSIIGAFPFTCW